MADLPSLFHSFEASLPIPIASFTPTQSQSIHLDNGVAATQKQIVSRLRFLSSITPDKFSFSDTISESQKLETENDDDDENPTYLADSIYHPRTALKTAIQEWLEDFFQDKKASGPIVKPHPACALAPVIPPIVPSINTCMTLTLTTPTASSSVSSAMMMPEVNSAQLLALAEICSSVTGATDMQPKPSVMNSLVSATKVVTTDVLSNPITAPSVQIPENLPVSSVPIPINLNNDTMDIEKPPAEIVSEEPESMDCGTPKHNSDTLSLNSVESPKDENVKSNGALEPEIKNEKSHVSDDVIMTESVSMQIEVMSDDDKNGFQTITFEDILLLCDLFYLPFEHGKQGLQLLNEFHWLKINANILLDSKTTGDSDNPEVEEWYRRSEKLLKLGDAIFVLTKRIAACVNRELCYDLFTYAWEISSVVSIFIAYVKWLKLGKFPANSNSFTQGSYTWFSKGWKETFQSGDQEPWVRDWALFYFLKY